MRKGNIKPLWNDIALFLRKNGRLVFVRCEGEHRVAFGNAVARFENSELFVEVLH